MAWNMPGSAAAGVAIVFVVSPAIVRADDGLAADKDALKPLQSLVGGWRGVGQPQRGSSKGAWTEQVDWAWHFADQRATLAFRADGGKYFVAGDVSPGEKPGEFTFVGRRAGGDEKVRYRVVRAENGDVVFDAAEAHDDVPARITVRQVAEGDRLVVLLERRLPGAGEARFARLAEIGYTRKGSQFAKGATGPECVVTGGAGTIPVTHEGKTYYVCCTGCKELFDDDPAKVLAEYRAKKTQPPAKQP